MADPFAASDSQPPPSTHPAAHHRRSSSTATAQAHATHAARLLAEQDQSIASPFEEEHPAAPAPAPPTQASPAPARPSSDAPGDTRLTIDDSQQHTLQPSPPRRSDSHSSKRHRHRHRRRSSHRGSHHRASDHGAAEDTDGEYDDDDPHPGQGTTLGEVASSMVSSILGVGRRIAARAEQERSAIGLGQSRYGADDASQPLFDADTEAHAGPTTTGSTSSEGDEPSSGQRTTKRRRRRSAFSPPPVPQDGTGYRPHYATRSFAAHGAVQALTPRERALWQWVNIVDLDAFLREAYSYYYGKGFVALVLAKLLGLATFAFVVIFSTFLGGCLDYSQIRHDGQLGDIVVPQCFSRFSWSSKFIYVVVMVIFVWQTAATAMQVPQLWAMRRFYTYVLDVPDSDVASISWNEVVNRLSHLRTTNPIVSLEPPRSPDSASRPTNDDTPNGMDAHDVANRIMRQENYLIALFNKDVPDLKPPLSPRLAYWARFVGITPEPILTRSLLWNLKYCLLDFLFDENGVIRPQFLSERYRDPLIRGLRHRFYFMALVNTVCSPFIVCYVLVYSFLRYFEEYHKDPSHLGSRQYTEWARWKFREFNELPHLFKRRIHRSYPAARRYINQFPKESVAIAARFVAFVFGAFTAVLLLASLYDAELFLHFYLLSQRNVLFYVSVCATITAVARGMIPEEHLVFDPDQTLAEVVDYIHYLPPHWVGHLHSAQVHQEFSRLCQLKLMLFVTELWSVLLTPFILWRSLPHSAPAIIDFFRLYTVPVEGLGHVCAFADFNLERNGNRAFGVSDPPPDPNMASKEGKMEQSVINFKAAHPDWHPHRASLNAYLARMSRLAPLTPAHHQSGEQSPSAPTTSAAMTSRASSPILQRKRHNFTPINSVMWPTAGEDEIAHSVHLGLARGGSSLVAGPGGLQAVQESQASLQGHPVEPNRRDPKEDGEEEDGFEHASDSAGLLPKQDPNEVDPQAAAAQAGVRGLLDQMYLQGPTPRRW